MRSARTAAMAVALIAGIAAPGHAGAWVGDRRQLTARIWVLGSNGSTYRVDLDVDIAGTDPLDVSELRVDIARCEGKRCVEVAHNLASLISAQVTVDTDVSHGKIETTYGGAPFVVTWTATKATQEALLPPAGWHAEANVGSNGHAPTEVTLLEMRRYDLRAVARLGGVTCASAETFGGVRIAADPVGAPKDVRSPVPASLPSWLRPAGRHVARCGVAPAGAQS